MTWFLTLEDMGMEVESSHHEAAPAQHEIDFRYGEIRKIADCITTFKMAVRIVAKRHGFMRPLCRSRKLK